MGGYPFIKKGDISPKNKDISSQNQNHIPAKKRDISSQNQNHIPTVFGDTYTGNSHKIEMNEIHEAKVAKEKQSTKDGPFGLMK